MLGVSSPDYFMAVDGGDISPTLDGPITFPQLGADLSPYGCLTGLGPLQAGQQYCSGSGGQDGTTGDTTDTSGLWSTIGGVAGSFLRAFTGGKGVTVSGNAGQAPKPPVTNTAGVSSSTLIIAGFGVLALLIFMLRKD